MKTLIQWKRAKDDLKQAIQVECAADTALKEADKHHRVKRPLNQSEKDAILGAFSQGKPLCCSAGHKMLTELGLDECWVDYLNDWAYEALSCTGFHKPDGDHYAQGLEDLRNLLSVEE